MKHVLPILGFVCVALVVVTCAPKHHAGLKKVYGSDHREAPTVDGLPEGDIGDVYTFVDPNDSTRVVFEMTVNGFSIPAEAGSYSLSPDMLYQFKIDNTGDAREDQVIQIVVNQLGQSQTASIYGPVAPTTTGARNTLVSGTPTITGTFGNTFGSATAVQAFVGMRDDPFVFDVAQFTRILNGSQDLFRQVGTSFRGRPVRADGTSGVDGFGGFNVTTIAVSVPKSMVRGTGSMINVWGTVSQRVPTRHGANVFQQFERAGQQAFAPVFIPAGAARDAQNFEIPEHDVANYSSLIPDALTTNDTDGSGNTFASRASLLSALGLTALPNGTPLLLPGTTAQTNKDLLRVALLPDVMRLNLDLAPGTLAIGQFGIQNGRFPSWNTLDVPLQLLRQLADVQFPSGIPGGGPLGARVALNCLAYPQCGDRRVLIVLQGTEFIKPDSTLLDYTQGGNDYPIPTTFPYMAAPHPLPGAAGTTDFPTQQ